MTKQIIPAANPPATDSPRVRHANDTLLVKLEPQFNRNLTGDTSEMNIVRELRMKFWVDGNIVKGNWTVVYQASWKNEGAIAEQMALGHLQLTVPAATGLNADNPTLFGFQWDGKSAEFPAALKGKNGNLQIMLEK
jgi:hypothetical protein